MPFHKLQQLSKCNAPDNLSIYTYIKDNFLIINLMLPGVIIHSLRINIKDSIIMIKGIIDKQFRIQYKCTEIKFKTELPVRVNQKFIKTSYSLGIFQIKLKII